MKTQTNTEGFTLVELIVVIAVIVVLTTVAMPSWATSKGHSQAAKCLSNLRQLTAAWAAYSNDNGGKLVPNADESNQPVNPTDPLVMPGGRLTQWCPGRQDIVSNLSPPGVSNNVNIGYQWIKAGAIYPYVGNVDAYFCAADTFNISAFGVKYYHVRSVSMNAWLSPFRPYGGITSVETYSKDTDLVRPGPSQLFVFMDENPVSINEGFIVFQPGITDWIDCPAFYHNGGGGLSFADGHAQIRRWTDSGILIRWNQIISAGNPNNSRVPADANSLDLSFLQNASTYLK